MVALDSGGQELLARYDLLNLRNNVAQFGGFLEIAGLDRPVKPRPDSIEHVFFLTAQKADDFFDSLFKVSLVIGLTIVAGARAGTASHSQPQAGGSLFSFLLARRRGLERAGTVAYREK